MSWGNVETVTVVRRARDDYGDQAETGRVEVTDVLWAPRSLSDEAPTVGRNVLTVDAVAYAPGPAPVTATDLVVRHRFGDQQYEVVGEPSRWQHPQSGRPDRLEIRLRRVTG